MEHIPEVKQAQFMEKRKCRWLFREEKLQSVVYLTYPNDRQATIMKSNMAMPAIKQEVIQAQSANVNTVSGATQTSESFIQSIASALSQAHKMIETRLLMGMPITIEIVDPLKARQVNGDKRRR